MALMIFCEMFRFVSVVCVYNCTTIYITYRIEALHVDVSMSICVLKYVVCVCAWMFPSEDVGFSLSGGILFRRAGWPLLLLLCEEARK